MNLLIWAAQKFQRIINASIRNLAAKMVNGEECEIAFFSYDDDILFVSKSEEEHLENLTAVFNRLETFGSYAD